MRPRYSPTEEIEFAARVGFLTRGIWQDFFSPGGFRWQSKIWYRLQKERLLLPYGGRLDVCLPNSKHALVQALVPFVARPPLLSQLVHDELVARSFIQLKRIYPGGEMKSEAYLKKESPINNKGLRVEEARKHPDLVLDLAGEKTAFEIELNQKSRARYRAILRGYRNGGFSRIIYLIRSEGTMNAVESAAYEVSFPRDKIQLGFGSIGEWKQSPIQTQIHFDHKSTAISELIVP
jgi:hypothetical protein